jgi:hypothetical protein
MATSLSQKHRREVAEESISIIRSEEPSLFSSTKQPMQPIYGEDAERRIWIHRRNASGRPPSTGIT